MQQLQKHLETRHLDISLHHVWLDEENFVATFPLWNLSGKLIGYQAYRPNADKVRKNDEKGRYYTFRGTKLIPNICQTVAVWGLESWYLSNTLFLTEGIFDAARLTKMKMSAIALLSNNPETSTRNWLKIVKQNRKVVAICDPGVSGRKFRNLGHDFYQMNDVDLGDAPQDIVNHIIRRLK